jgi:hypothetical protein
VFSAVQLENCSITSETTPPILEQMNSDGMRIIQLFKKKQRE